MNYFLKKYYEDWTTYGTDPATDSDFKKYLPPPEYGDEIELIINGSLSHWWTTNFSFQRTIAPDNDIIWETIKELQRRGIGVLDPENPNATRAARCQ